MQLYTPNEDLTIYNSRTSIKERAASYLGKVIGDPLSQAEARKCQAKARKLKKSSVKAQRNRSTAFKHLKIDEPYNS